MLCLCLNFCRSFSTIRFLSLQSSPDSSDFEGLILDPPFHQPHSAPPRAAAAAAAAAGGGGGHQLHDHLRRGPVHGREVAGDAHREAALAEGARGLDQGAAGC